MVKLLIWFKENKISTIHSSVSLSLSRTQTHTLTHTLNGINQTACRQREPGVIGCSGPSMLTLAVPSSLRLMMSKSKSLLRPSVLLRTMCPVSPSHCACREDIRRDVRQPSRGWAEHRRGSAREWETARGRGEDEKQWVLWGAFILYYPLRTGIRTCRKCSTRFPHISWLSANVYVMVLSCFFLDL